MHRSASARIEARFFHGAGVAEEELPMKREAFCVAAFDAADKRDCSSCSTAL